MTTPASPSPAPAKKDRDAADAAAGWNYEERLQMFWDRNYKLIIGALIVVLLAILAKGGWEYFQTRKDVSVRHDFSAATTAEKLKSFAAANPDHPLAGVAHLQLADEAYAAGRFADAATEYDRAATTLPAGPFRGRAHLGAAMAKLEGGKTAEGEAGLQQIAADASENKAIRAEADYQLASRAAAAGKAEDLKKISEHLMQVDPSSPWTQRVMTLRSTLTPPVSAPSAATVKLPATTGK
jgi:hypothetical protein